MKGKSQNWVETQSSVQSPLQKFICGNNGQNLSKSRYQSFVVLCNFTGFAYFWQSILSLIAGS